MARASSSSAVRNRRAWMSVLLSLCMVLTLLTPMAAVADEHDEGDEPRVLVFSATAGFRHQSIPAGVAAVEQLGIEHGFAVDTTEDATQFTDENLANYDAVVWLSTTGSVLNSQQQAAFESYIQAGGGYAGIHAASDTHYDWAWYGDLVGAYFRRHPPGTQTADVWVTDQAHPSTDMLPGTWERHDEWYDFDVNPRGDVHVLATIDEDSYADQVSAGPDMGWDHPIAWCQPYDGGRSWYTAGGHTNASFSEPLFLEHMAGGILWAAGEVDGDCGGTVWDNYEKVILDDDVVGPMIVEPAPDGRVFYLERDGRVQLIDEATGTTTTALELDVYTGQEDGLGGMVFDPNFEDNGWVYLFFAPAGSDQVNRVSRFTMEGDTIDPASESVVIDIPVQRQECCHAGGDLEFGPDGELYISTGDDTNPFASQNYTPIDERPGRSAWDAQRTSANTNDLRGKLLRIVPQDEGGYSVPEGNLFAPGTELTRPEIYAMGLRNPYRFSVDQSNGQVYLADYGPDAGSDSATRGPRGRVTWHIIDEPANYGWPYCHANEAYIDWDFETLTSGAPFDCEGGPINDSPNNTGLTQTPPVKDATVWYGYQAAEPFPMLAGGAPMGGPRYEYDPDMDSDIKWPASFDGSVVFGEWGRHQLWDFNLNDDASDVTQISRLVPDMTFSNPMDFAFGPTNGALYVVEWGRQFGGPNPNSKIVRIDYTGAEDPDRPQVSVTADPTSGDAPLDVDFTAEASSPVGADIVSYDWDFGDGATGEGATTSHTYTDPGSYRAEVTVTDDEGRTGSAGVTITAEGDTPAPPAGDLVCLGDLSDDFSGSELDRNRWSRIVREDQGGYSLGGGSLTMDATATDIYGTNNTGTPNIILQPLPDGPWEATLQLTMEAYRAYQQAGLIVYGDDNNYAKMVLQGRDTANANPGSRIFQFIREENGQPNEVGDSNTGPLGADFPDTVWVRFTSDGSALNASYSADGVDFTQMPQTKQLAGIDNPHIGLFAVAGNNQPPTTADFNLFELTPDPTAQRPELASDEFEGDQLDGCRWDRVVRYDPETLQVTGGQLLIETPPGDIYQTPNDPVTNFILQTQPDGDWTVETKYTEELVSGYSQAGLIIYADDDNYVKWDTVADINQTGVNRVELRSEVNGQITNPQPTVQPVPANDGEWWLRLSKEGDTFSGSVSVDGETWIDAPQSVSNALAAAEGAVGLFTLAVQDPPTTVAFDYFRVLGEEITDPDPDDLTVEATLDPADPDGDNDWYVSPVTISLSSNDDDATLQWRLAGADDWITWTEPVTVDTDGVYDIEYRAIIEGAGGTTPDPATVDVAVGQGGFVFVPDEIEANQGDTILYTLVAGFHNVVTVTEDGTEIDRSPLSSDWGTHEFEATEPGLFYIYCTPHATTSDPDPANWSGMVGTVTVSPATGGSEDLVSEIGEASFQLDQAPPETTASLTGERGGDVYTGEVGVTLEATDETSGVAETHYRIDGGEDFEVYDGPFEVEGDGDYVLEYRSADVAGNVEDWRSTEFTIDSSVEPDLTVTATLDPAEPDGEEGWYVSPVTISLSSNDDEATLQWRLAGDSSWITWTEPVTIDTDGVYDVEYRAVVGDGTTPDPTPVTVAVGPDALNVFEPDDLTVTQGTPISFERISGFHDVVILDANENEVARSELNSSWQTYDFVASETGSFTFYCTPHINQGMTGTLQVNEPDLTGRTSEIGEASFQLDTTPPETTASVDGPQAGAVFIDDVSLSLSAEDATSGVAETHVREAGDEGFDVYEGPLDVAGDGTYTFEFRSADVAGNVEDWQTVTFEIDSSIDPPTGTVCDRHQGGATFPDSPGSGHRYFIDCLAELGIVKGYTDGTFGPRDDVSRGQLASFVVRSIELATGETMEAGGELFPDVGVNSEHGPAIYKLRNAEIIRGFDDGTFRPRQSVTRDQTARYVVNALELVLGEELETSGAAFPDVAAGSQYAVDVDKLVTAGVISGFEDGTFGPRKPVTRAQMTRFIGNALNVLDEAGVYQGP